MNIIENVWSILERRVYAGGRQYSNCHELMKAIEISCESIDEIKIQGLYNGLQSRIMALYDSRGKSAQY